MCLQIPPVKGRREASEKKKTGHDTQYQTDQSPTYIPKIYILTVTIHPKYKDKRITLLNRKFAYLILRRNITHNVYGYNIIRTYIHVHV